MKFSSLQFLDKNLIFSLFLVGNYFLMSRENQFTVTSDTNGEGGEKREGRREGVGNRGRGGGGKKERKGEDNKRVEGGKTESEGNKLRSRERERKETGEIEKERERE
jgi:hypothetical protein